MKQILTLIVAGSLALPALADTPTPQPDNELSRGAEMLSDGAKLLLRGLLAESAEGWEQLTDWLDDLSQYEAPEMLPNGDILIRRKLPIALPAETEL